MNILKRSRGFTLVELVITIAIVIILSVISVPIYRGYVDKAKMSEGYALLGQILSAQKNYYSEYGNFLKISDTSSKTYSNYEAVLNIDARGNKYFTIFAVNGSGGDSRFKYYFVCDAFKAADIGKSNASMILQYNVTLGAHIFEGNGEVATYREI